MSEKSWIIPQPDVDGMYVAESGSCYDCRLDYVATELLGFCGCGSPDAAVEYIRDVLAEFKERSDSEWTINKVSPRMEALGDGLACLVLYILDNHDLLEHGTSVYGSWLTAKGEQFLADLNAILAETA